MNQTYDVTNTEPVLEEEFNSSCNDTTNEDDEFISVHSAQIEKKSSTFNLYKNWFKVLFT